MFKKLREKLFGPDKDLNTPTTTFAGQPLHVNPPPQSREAQIRSVARCIALAEAAAETTDPIRIESLRAEYQRRKHELASAGVNLPASIEAKREVLEQLTNG